MQSEPSGAQAGPATRVTSSSATTLELSWPSQLSSIGDAVSTIDTLVTRLGGDAAMRHAVELALREALANAIRHGHAAPDGHAGPDAPPRLELTVVLTPGALELTVRDRGPGFDPANVVDPTQPDRRLATSGRGLHLIRHAMDHAEWSPRPGGGTCLHMRKRWP